MLFSLLSRLAEAMGRRGPRGDEGFFPYRRLTFNVARRLLRLTRGFIST